MSVMMSLAKQKSKNAFAFVFSLTGKPRRALPYEYRRGMHIRIHTRIDIGKLTEKNTRGGHCTSIITVLIISHLRISYLYTSAGTWEETTTVIHTVIGVFPGSGTRDMWWEIQSCDWLMEVPILRMTVSFFSEGLCVWQLGDLCRTV